ncbi:MAG: hypothetical protein A2Z72_07490 [Omnitrophica bacterium RBG_13_46_9]|nr:MAG: hypothetical protein A2Z72_07490 [Omnitrophica bacterium RBG_13_46_9]
MKFFEKERLLIATLILFSASLFFIGLGAMSLTDPDEVFYAETAKEMLNRHQMLTPYIFGEPQFEKPPLYYWLVILGFKVFGINEFAARVASAIFGILGVVSVYFLGKILMDRKTGFCAGITLATSIEYLVLSRACVTDIVLGVFILCAFLFFFHGYLAGSGKTRYYLLSSLFLGLSVLTKGPVGVFLPFVIIGIYVILTREIKLLKEVPFIRGTLLFLVVSLPWYLLMYKAHGRKFIDVFFGFHNVIRFLEPEHKWGDVFYYYFPNVIVGFFPWIMFLPLGIWQVFREENRRFRKAGIFLITWFLVIFTFFSFSRTKLPTYIFPLYPALALLTGRFWGIFLDKGLTQKMERAMKGFLGIFLISIAGGMIGLSVITAKRYPPVTGVSVITGIIFVSLMTFFITALLKRRYTASLIALLLSFIILVFPLSYVILPEIAKYESSKEVSAKVLTFMEPGERLGAETQYRRGVAFYTNREDILDVHRHHIITTFLNGKERVWCIIKDKNHIQLYTDEKHPYDKPTYVVYKSGKKVIITNKAPKSGEFLKVRTKDAPF